MTSWMRQLALDRGEQLLPRLDSALGRRLQLREELLDLGVVGFEHRDGVHEMSLPGGDPRCGGAGRPRRLEHGPRERSALDPVGRRGPPTSRSQSIGARGLLLCAAPPPATCRCVAGRGSRRTGGLDQPPVRPHDPPAPSGSTTFGIRDEGAGIDQDGVGDSRQARNGDAAPMQNLGEDARVAEGTAASVVVEVHEGGGFSAPGRFEPRRPCRQLVRFVARPRCPATGVEPHIGPVGGPPDRGDRAAAVGEAQRHAAVGERSAKVVGEPRGMTRFDHEPESRGERVQRLFERLQVDLEIGRQLDQDRAQVRSELGRPLDEQPDRWTRIAEPADMGQVATCLDREQKPVGDPRRPRPERRARRHAIERDVQLDGVEGLRIELELRAASRRRVEPSPPMLVDEPRCSDPDRHAPSLPVRGHAEGRAAGLAGEAARAG